MSTEKMSGQLADARLRASQYARCIAIFTAEIDSLVHELSRVQKGILERKREIRRAAVMLDCAKSACRALDVASPVDYSTENTALARHYLHLVVSEHRAKLNHLAEGQWVLKRVRKNTGAHISQVQRVMTAYVQEWLDKHKD